MQITTLLAPAGSSDLLQALRRTCPKRQPGSSSQSHADTAVTILSAPSSRCYSQQRQPIPLAVPRRILQLAGASSSPRAFDLARPFSSFKPSAPSREPTSTSPGSAPVPGSSSERPPPPLPRRARDDYRKQLVRLRHELNLLRQRLPPLPARTRSNLARTLLAILVALVLLYHTVSPFRRLVIAAERCSRVAWAVFRCIIDYKILFRGSWPETPEGKQERHEAYETCHSRCAVRIREVLKKNGGIYIKLGQHLSAVQLIPTPWCDAMRPLQDQCQPTPLAELQQLFLTDVGAPLSTFFSSFDPEPIGVASLAQVHRARDRETGKQVAVKIMHPDLEEFCEIDMKTTTAMLKFVKSVFPSFEFTWLGEEMEENLPLEMDFRHEAANAARCSADFASLKSTTLVVPQVLWAKKRAMVMEFIEGSRIDDLHYLAVHQIDRNQVAKQLQHIFSRMLYITGFWHGDPHGGNLLIRPAQPGSRSPYNFEIVLLDHGLYFEMDSTLRVNYAKLWLSLISPASVKVEADRRKYAYVVGNIDDELYPIFQSAITGRVALDDPYADQGLAEGEAPAAPRGSVMDLADNSEAEQKRIRHVLVQQEGLMMSLFDLLRRVPRKLLMVLKVNDLTRALDKSLHTTHGPTRIFLILAHYCNLSVYLDDLQQLSFRYRTSGLSFSLVGTYLSSWWRYQVWNVSLKAAELGADTKGRAEKTRLWFRGLRQRGFQGAWEEQAGLAL